jgi:integrase
MGRRRGHGEGSIFQRESDGKWCAVVDLGYMKGKRRRKTIYGKTRKEVAEKLKALHRDVGNGIPVATDNQTVAEFLKRWLDDVVAQRNKPRTEDSYREMVRLHIEPAIGRCQLTKLNPEHVQAMMTVLTKKGLSARTVNYARTIVRRALSQAMRWGLVARNVAALVEPPREERRQRVVLTMAQAKSILEAVKGHRYEVLYRVALSLGLRRGEILGLRWQDVDFAARTLTVRGTLQRIRKQLVWSTPKTVSSVRTLPIPPTLLAALQAHWERQQELWPEAVYVFVSTHGTPIDPMNLTHHFKTLAKVIGLPAELRLHDLRHSCATMMIAQGIHPRVIMQTLGHSQISTTMDIYGHVMEETLREAADKLDGLLGE